MPDHSRYVLPTVDIVHPDGADKGRLTINESDFDSAIHVKWADRKPASDPKADPRPKPRRSDVE